VPEAGAPPPLAATMRAALGEEPGALRDELATLFVAGHETTGAALTWTFHLLSLHPEPEAGLHAEANAAAEPGPFTRAVIDESMRLYPPVPTIARAALADDTLAGRAVRAGTTIIIAPWLIHRHRTLWREPERFDPARFLPGAPDRPRFAFLPFGGGAHVCLGASLALLELGAAVTAIARRYVLRPASPEPVEPVGLITLWPRGGLAMRLTRRR
jgi:cytochrome P450